MSTPDRRTRGIWIILAGATPTSFRARTRDLLVPTLVQLQRTQPDVSLKWFERGRVWESPLEAREALAAQRRQRRERPPDWRPGGTHKDPRQRFELSRDEKRAKFKARQRRFGPPSGESRGPGGTTGSGKPSGPKGWGGKSGPGSSHRPGGSNRPAGFGKPAGRGWQRGPRGPRGPKGPRNGGGGSSR